MAAKWGQKMFVSIELNNWIERLKSSFMIHVQPCQSGWIETNWFKFTWSLPPEMGSIQLDWWCQLWLILHNMLRIPIEWKEGEWVKLENKIIESGKLQVDGGRLVEGLVWFTRLVVTADEFFSICRPSSSSASAAGLMTRCVPVQYKPPNQFEPPPRFFYYLWPLLSYLGSPLLLGTARKSMALCEPITLIGTSVVLINCFNNR